jgi:CHAT domain-containing protein
MSRRPAFPLAVLFLSALLAGSGCQHLQDENRDVPISENRARLIKILDSRRLTEGRLRGFSYAPFLSNRPGPELSKDQRIELRKLLREPPDSTPEAAADRALLKWIAGNFEEAIRGMEEALASAPAPATLLSDLSAFYLANARRKDDPYSRVKALEAAENAIALDPSLQEARFNRALALESLFLNHQARSAWDDSLKLDGASGWAGEARARRRALAEPDAASRWDLESQKLTAAFAANDQATIDRTVKGFPQAARESVEEKLLGEWASALGKRSAEAQGKLAAARAIGAALVKANGERMVRATVEAIDRADSTRLPILANGHSLYREGLGLYNEGKFAEARDRFAAARAALDHAESPFAGWATFRLAVSEMQLFHYERALALLAGLDRSGFQSLAGRSLWVEGLILAIQGKYMESVAVYRSALRHFDAIGERENLAVVRSLTAESLAALGDFPGAWNLHLDALSLVGALRNPARRQQVFEQASATALQMEKPAATLDFLQEALGASSSVPAPAVAYCLRRKALAHCRLNQSSEAEKDIQKAKAMVSQFPDEHVRKSVLGDLLAAEGGIIASKDPAVGIARLTEAIQTYDRTGYSAQLALLLAERARAYRATAETALAEGDLQRAISLVQSQRSLVDDRGLQISYLKEFSSIFDDMVDLQLHLGHKERALDYVEGSRAQVLRELLPDAKGERVGKVATVRALQRELPEKVAIVEYHVLPGKLLAWVIRKGALDVFETEINPEELRLQVESFRGKVLNASADPRRDPESRRLYDLLIGKLSPRLQGAAVLALVPDRDLHALPFAALPDGSSGNYLIHRYALSLAPSANIYIEALGHESRSEASPAVRPLVIGDPAFDLHGLWTLPRLPGAKEEAESVAAMYPGTRLLLGIEATRKGFLDGLNHFGMIHFAGHAIGNSAHPLSSFLVLAPMGKGSGILYARDLYGVRGAKTRLVALSACSGMAGELLGEEGMESLTRPFLAMGVPAVVASLWEADDRANRVLFTEFHRRLAGGTSVVVALRQAQMALETGSNPLLAPPKAWAGFQLTGAGLSNPKEGKSK